MLFAAGGFLVASTQSGKLREQLEVASITLVFVAFIGGLVKLLFEDFQRMREKRAESARFLTAILADLKSVYDRVERVRILIPAHRSALTYGNEMRDLIDARVQLRNVIRALDPNTSGIPNPPLDDLRNAVQAMETYLHDLTDEFQWVYLPIAKKQGVYEARKKKALESMGAPDVENEAWTDIASLPGMKGFIGDWRAQQRPDTPHEYVERFETPLDRASLMLRSELGAVAGKKRVPLPGG